MSLLEDLNVQSDNPIYAKEEAYDHVGREKQRS